ncbi:uncharacterized protein SPAR_L01100 [Saccharomyces paradoxus]|uniref:Uncharacterized protein n=1 Tax=Saccharomyces paradoxus TaxID=27291 RepID=A0A8B8UVU6_SACPA|nr:uncharacterized protein SPAR_L01100 [Saccharomyces paradoxus]QHS74799.1 hypothetical protein SPAR_L01100 [Saccharomyces paradoxus]
MEENQLTCLIDGNINFLFFDSWRNTSSTISRMEIKFKQLFYNIGFAICVQ